MKSVFAIATLAAVAQAKKLHCDGDCRSGENVDSIMYQSGSMAAKQQFWDEQVASGAWPVNVAKVTAETRCVDGKAGEYDCDGVDLVSFISLRDLRPGNNRAGNSNDIWGWTDPETNREYAIICLVDGTTFIDVTEPANPVALGFLEDTNGRSASWRDAKVFENHAFIGSETQDHGMQVFDLTRLRNMNGNPTNPGDVPVVEADALYTEFGSSHNIVLNEASGVVYAVGSRTCRGGLHMVDVKDPLNPTFLGCYDDDGYTHDAECVTYTGPDLRYTDSEICFNYNEDTLTIVDVTDKANPNMLSRVPYSGSQYTHQGWLTSDGRHLLMNDELDEQRNANLGGHTRTLVWNVENLEAPFYLNDFLSPATAIDHNLYIRNNVGYLSNYSSGLRIMDTSQVGTQNSTGICQMGFFDVAPNNNNVNFSGTWSNFPFYREEGLVAVSSIERGFFMLRVQRGLTCDRK